MPRTGSGAPRAVRATGERRASRALRVLRAATLVAVLGLLPAACASDDGEVAEVPPGSEEEAAPPLGPSVAVVLPEQGVYGELVLAEVRAALEDVLAREAARDRPVDVPVPLASVRVVVAADAAELRDQVAVLAESGTDLICVLGGVGDEALRDAARLHARPTYCELPAAPVEPGAAGTNGSSRLTVEVPMEGLGRELGALARAAASERVAVPAPVAPAEPDARAAGPGGPPRVVAVVTGTDPTIGAALRRGVLAEDGAAEGAAATDVLFLAPEPGRAAAEVVAGLLEASVDVLIVDGAPGADALVAAALDAGLAVLAPEALVADLPEGLDAGVVATWRTRWDRALELVVARVREAPGPSVLEVALGDFVELRPGPAAGPAVLARIDATTGSGG